MGLNREAILGLDDLKRETVEVPEWGGTVTVRGMTGAERAAFEASLMNGEKNSPDQIQNIRARLVAYSAIYEDGSRMFTDEDIPTLNNKNAAALDRIAKVAQRLSGILQDSVEDAVKN